MECKKAAAEAMYVNDMKQEVISFILGHLDKHKIWKAPDDYDECVSNWESDRCAVALAHLADMRRLCRELRRVDLSMCQLAWRRAMQNALRKRLETLV